MDNTPGKSPRKVRVGLVGFRSDVWHGGSLYIENLARLLEGRNDVEPVMVVEDDASVSSLREKFASLEIIAIEPTKRRFAEAFQEHLREKSLERQGEIDRRRKLNRFQRIWMKLDPLIALPERPDQNQHLIEFVRQHKLDLLFPLPELRSVEVPGICWIPDFQHRFLPENFSEEEILAREERFAQMAVMPELLLSSEDCREHFLEAYPDSRTTVSVWRFCSLIRRGGFVLDPEEVRKKYHLPEEFFLVANQFWKHKDHAVVLSALERVGETGKLPHVVFTGALRSGRDVSHIDAFLQAVQEKNLHDKIRILGFTDREEQLALMRRANAVIHPSRFEGWSTVVEDCRALGQRLILSDLRVHLEQNPPHAEFFKTADPRSLAKAILGFLSESAGEWEQGRHLRERKSAMLMEGIEKKVADDFASIAVGVARRCGSKTGK